MGYQKIFVALDRHNEVSGVFDKALELAKNDAATLMIFHCMPIESPSLYDYGDIYGGNIDQFSRLIQDQIDRETESNRQWLEGLCKQAIAVGVAAEWDWKLGSAGSWICKVAASWEADLIVMGRRGHRGLAEIVLGSVSNYVLHHASCSVLIVQNTR